MTTKTNILAALGLIIAMLAPAGAARAAEIDCGLEQITPAQRPQIDAMVSRVLHDETGQYQPTADDEAASATVFTAITGCAERLNWSDAKKDAAMRYMLLRMTADRAAAELRALGVATAPLAKIVAANPAIFVPGITPIDRGQARDKLVADSTAAGIPMSKAGVEMLVLAYFGSTTLANQAAADFAKG